MNDSTPYKQANEIRPRTSAVWLAYQNDAPVGILIVDPSMSAEEVLVIAVRSWPGCRCMNINAGVFHLSSAGPVHFYAPDGRKIGLVDGEYVVGL